MTQKKTTPGADSRLSMDDRIEDVLTLYAAGLMTQASKDARSSGWFRRAHQAAFQMGRDFKGVGGGAAFGVPALDRAFRRGQKRQFGRGQARTKSGCQLPVARLSA
ncbi:MAG: hypothetical protein OXC07_11160 [Kistimonas sp.]|nr:hypothetical protein [Kistimonas sp.]